MLTVTRERHSIEVVAATAGRSHPQLRLLVLFGSRARGDAHEESDWDLGYLAEPGVDALALHAELVEGLGTERVDLVDLERAGGLLRFRAARDGRALVDSNGHFEAFWIESVRFWCDAQPILDAGFEDILRELPS